MSKHLLEPAPEKQTVMTPSDFAPSFNRYPPKIFHSMITQSFETHPRISQPWIQANAPMNGNSQSSKTPQLYQLQPQKAPEHSLRLSVPVNTYSQSSMSTQPYSPQTAPESQRLPIRARGPSRHLGGVAMSRQPAMRTHGIPKHPLTLQVEKALQQSHYLSVVNPESTTLEEEEKEKEKEQIKRLSKVLRIFPPMLKDPVQAQQGK